MGLTQLNIACKWVDMAGHEIREPISSSTAWEPRKKTRAAGRHSRKVKDISM